MRWTKIAIYGAAQVGKTGLVNLFLNKLPSFSDEGSVNRSAMQEENYGEDDKGYGSECDHQDPCLEVRLEEMENKEEFNDYRFYARQIDPKYIWNLYDVDSLYLKLHEIIADHLANPPELVPSMFSILNAKEPKEKYPPPPPPPKLRLPEDSTENIIEVCARIVLRLLPVTADMNKIEKNHWIYVADCTGETTFLEIAPLLMQFFCINITCYRAIDTLKKSVEFKYCVDGKPVLGKAYRTIENQELTKMIFAGKVEIKHPYVMGVSTGRYERRNYFSVASTFYDTYLSLEKENKLTETLAEQNEWYHEDLKTFSHVRVDLNSLQGQVSYPFNTAARLKKDLKAVERFRRMANHCYMEVEFPIRWYLFFLQINEVKGSSRVMISFNECKIMASLVGIHSVDVVRAALEYFHDLMLIFYFPAVLPDVIFLTQKRIFDKLSEVIAVFVGVHNGNFNPHHLSLLRDHGILERALLDDLAYGFIPNFFSPDDFLRLLHHLYVVHPLGNNRFYFPFMLKEFPDVYNHMNTERLEPIMYYWKKGCVPVPTGFFYTFIHYLWKMEDSVFKLPEDLSLNYRNKFTFDCPTIEGQVIIFETKIGIGVSHTAHLKHCLFVRKALLEAMMKVCELLDYRDDLRPRVGFLCRNTDEEGSCCRSPPHVARVNKQEEFTQCKDIEYRYFRDLLKDFTQLPWFIPIGELTCSCMIYTVGHHTCTQQGFSCWDLTTIDL